MNAVRWGVAGWAALRGRASVLEGGLHAVLSMDCCRVLQGCNCCTRQRRSSDCSAVLSLCHDSVWCVLQRWS